MPSILTLIRHRRVHCPNFFPVPTSLMLSQRGCALSSLFWTRLRCSFSTFSEGTPLAIEWKGSSWKARVKQLDPKRSRILVEYDGWSDRWDEWLSAEDTDVRIRMECTEGKSTESTFPYQSRIVQDVVVEGKSYRTASLKDGRTVFLDPETGILAWFPNVSPRTTLSAEPGESTELPEGWIVRKDSRESTYYFNTVNWKAQWIKPRLPAAEVSKNMQRVAEVIPSGWEAYFDKDGYPYYYNAQTSETVWEFPVSENTVTESTAIPSTKTDISSVPEGWEIYFTDDGVPYFYCRATNQSYWELPEGVGSSAMDLPTCSENPFEEVSKKKKSQKRTSKKLAN